MAPNTNNPIKILILKFYLHDKIILFMKKFKKKKIS